jgi:hypothetical protein
VLLYYIIMYIPLTLYSRRSRRGISDISTKTPIFYQNYLAMRNTADMTGGKPIAVLTTTTDNRIATNCIKNITTKSKIFYKKRYKNCQQTSQSPTHSLSPKK